VEGGKSANTEKNLFLLSRQRAGKICEKGLQITIENLAKLKEFTDYSRRRVEYPKLFPYTCRNWLLCTNAVPFYEQPIRGSVCFV
jgi:hypothetical protein